MTMFRTSKTRSKPFLFCFPTFLEKEKGRKGRMEKFPPFLPRLSDERVDLTPSDL